MKNPDALEVQGISAGYGKITVVEDMTFRVPKGSVVALLGPNGAGKTTLLKTIAGLIKPSEGRILAGGLDVTGARPSRVSRAGVCLIPEGRGIFRSLTVKENLLLHIPPWCKSVNADKALEVFPILKEKLNTNAGNLSGGQQQMLAMGRAYLCEPKIVLLDEVSMGLAPIVLDEVFDSIRSLARQGLTLLLVEQYVNRALEMADRVYLMSRGVLTFEGDPGELDSSIIEEGYLGSRVDKQSNGAGTPTLSS